jgi:molybdenum cofactor cytidylyltransferase
MPWILPQTYQQVRQALAGGCDVARPVHHDRPGHPVGCASRLKDAVMSLPDKDGLGSMFHRPGLHILQLEVSDSGCTRDIDFPADLD